MKFFIKTYGCSQNQADSIIIKELLKKQGYSQAKDESEADVIIVNTCTVKTPTEQRIKRYLQDYCDKKIVVAGCMTATHKKMLEKYPLMGCENLSDIAKIIKGELKHSLNSSAMKKINKVPISVNEIIEIVPISKGCLGNCSYCATKFARGKLSSYPRKEIINHVKNALKRGKKEFWITSQDNGCYGLDRKDSLVNLLNDLIALKGFFKIRLGMINPAYAKMYKKDLAKILSNEKFFKFLHMPIQSASNKVLKMMNRIYSKKDIKNLIKFFRKNVKGIAFATDVIIGFPGESLKDFNETYELIRELKPEVLNISKYWNRPKTKASLMKNQVELHEMKRRAIKLMDLHKKHNLEKPKNCANDFALVDQKGFARTSNYFKIKTCKKLGEYYRV